MIYYVKTYDFLLLVNRALIASVLLLLNTSGGGRGSAGADEVGYPGWMCVSILMYRCATKILATRTVC